MGPCQANFGGVYSAIDVFFNVRPEKPVHPAETLADPLSLCLLDRRLPRPESDLV